MNRKLTLFRKYLTFENLCLNPDHLAIFEGNFSGQLYWAISGGQFILQTLFLLKKIITKSFQHQVHISLAHLESSGLRTRPQLYDQKYCIYGKIGKTLLKILILGILTNRSQKEPTLNMSTIQKGNFQPRQYIFNLVRKNVPCLYTPCWSHLLYIGWPQQPPTEKLLEFNMIFHDSIPNSFFSKHQNKAEFKNLNDS